MSRDDVRRQLESLFSDYPSQPDPDAGEARSADGVPEIEAKSSEKAPPGSAEASSEQPDEEAGTGPGEPGETASTETRRVSGQAPEVASDRELSQPSARPPQPVAKMHMGIEKEDSPVTADVRTARQSLPQEGGLSQQAAEGDVEGWRGRLLDVVLGGAALGGCAVFLVLLVDSLGRPSRLPALFPVLSAVILTGGASLIRGLSVKWKAAVVIVVAYGAALFSVWQHGALSVASWYLLAIPVLFLLFVGERAGLIAAGVHVVLYVALASGQGLVWPGGAVDAGTAAYPASSWLPGVTYALIVGLIVAVQRYLVQDRRAAAAKMQEQSHELRVAEQVSREERRQLAATEAAYRQQARYLRLSEQMARLMGTGSAPPALAERLLRLLRDEFDADFVGLFTMDGDTAGAVLWAGAQRNSAWELGEPVHISLSEHDLLRECVSHGQVRVAEAADPLPGVRLDGEIPQGARPAVAIPLMGQGGTDGVIVAQGVDASPSWDRDVAVLRAIGGLASLLLSNAHLSEELVERQHEAEILRGQYVREAWQRFTRTRAQALDQYEEPDAGAFSELALSELDLPARMSPIRLGDETVGDAGVDTESGDPSWADEQREVVAAISEQMALILENSPLFEEARMRAVRERRAREITARIRESLDVDTMLRTAVREIGESLGIAEVEVRMQGEPEEGRRWTQAP